MDNIVESIKNEILDQNEIYKQKYNLDLWDEHIGLVVENAKMLSDIYKADTEIVMLGALLHDVARIFKEGPSREHHIYGAKLAVDMLKKYNYPDDKIEKVRKCVLNHSGDKEYTKETLEEECVADADALAHFDNISFLYYIALQNEKRTVCELRDFVKDKLIKDYEKFSPKSKIVFKDKYENILKTIFKGE